MSKRKEPRHAPPNDPRSDWPGWFIELAHPAEYEMLRRLLQNDSRLSEIHFTVTMMQVNYIVFQENYSELLRLEKQFDQPYNFGEIALRTQKGRQIAQDVMLEFTRFLHNFLASEKMLVDVTRRWVREQFSESQFLGRYQAEISKRFVDNVQARFLNDLRNFALNRTLPLSIPELRVHKIDEHTVKSSLGMVLLKEQLLEWDKWSELGRIQLQMAFEGEVDIMSICKQYFQNVTEFTQWLFWQVRELFGAEIDQINSVVAQMRGDEK